MRILSPSSTAGLCLVTTAVIAVPAFATDSATDNGTPPPAKAAAAPEAPMATVNGEPISRAMYDVYARQRQAQIREVDPTEAREGLIDELINQLLLVQEAEKQNLQKHPQVALQLEILRRRILAGAALRELMKNNPPDEAMLQKEYEKSLAARQDPKEYKARHILLDSEEKASSVIAALESDADFSELAATHSSDNSNTSGGDLGWFSPDIMPPEFAAAVADLSPGEYTREPVKTRFGWHVIVLDDTRDVDPPTLESMRTQLQQKLQDQMLNDHLNALRQQAEIDMK